MQDKCMLILIGLFAANVMFVPRTIAQDKTPKEIEDLFAGALTADQKQYVSIRQEIVANKTAIQFLIDKSSNTDIYTRVLSEAMLTWATNAALNERREKALSQAVIGIEQQHGGPWLLTRMRSDAALPRNELHDGSSVPFLLEVLLKETTDQVRRSYAAVLVGGYDNRDAIVVLANILNSKANEPFIRACAATGLRRTKSADAVEPLINALSDEKDAVKKSATMGLKELTGQDFGTDQVKYRDWWKANKDKFPKKDTTK